MGLLKLQQIKGAGFVLLALSFVSFSSSYVLAEEPEGDGGQGQIQGGAKRVNVEKLKKQYWSQESDYNVVQNRVYTKANRIETSLYAGSMLTDPFLSVSVLGISLGYHFNEQFSLHGLLWRNFSSRSSALERLEVDTNRTANTNDLLWYYGGEVRWSVIYGKLSLLGKTILYYDMHLSGGAGQMKTESGDNFAQSLGLGQQVYLSQSLGLFMGYRMVHFDEKLLDKAGSGVAGTGTYTPKFSRSNFSHTLLLGISWFLF